MSSSMRLNQSKNIGYKIEIMKWSNRMDLLAISNDKGEVIVQRMNFQKIWTHPPPVDTAHVRGIDWRPDEKIIAVGYSTGLVVLLDIENQHVINSIKLDGDIACMGWTQNTREISNSTDADNKLNVHDTYLPQLPSFNSLSSTAPKTDYNAYDSYSKKILNILIVGLTSGVVHTSVFGVLPCGRIDVAAQTQLASQDFRMVEAKMSSDFKEVYVGIRLGDALKLIVFENEMFPIYLDPLLNLATKHGYILNTMAYIEEIIQCISEAWETALLEMDNKLTKYANAQPAGTVSADFFELLMMGFPSESLEEFLTRTSNRTLKVLTHIFRDLTEKGLKKLGTSIEISYSTIQKLVIKPLHSGILNICYHLNCIKGMSKNTYYYKPLLGTPSNDAIQNAGSFLIKSLELQQTIEQSTRDYKIFWCWLYGVIIRLMDETVPDDIAAVSQQDIIYLAEFLNNFDANSDEIDISSTDIGDRPAPVRKRFNLERVGQYLEDKNLQIQPGDDLTQRWNQLLNENECLRKCDIIYPHHKHMSLVQQHNILKSSIDELFSRPETLMGNNFTLKLQIDCAIFATDSVIQTSHMNIESANVNIFAALIGQKTLLLVELNPSTNQTKAIKLEFQQKSFFDERLSVFGELSLCDVQFYNDDHLSILLHNEARQRACNCFVQFPLTIARNRMMVLSTAANATVLDISNQLPIVNLYELIDAQLIRSLDGADMQTISVSGSRKVAALLAKSQKRIRLYEMEVEEEDEDMDVSSQNNSLDVSKESNQS